MGAEPGDDPGPPAVPVTEAEAVDAAPVNDFATMSLEQLMGIQVTSVAGIAEDWFRSPSAITVLTADDIRRSGHQSLAEVLRMVPGLHVAQVSSSIWSIDARGGFGGRFSNTLLVMIDGRTVYDPLFSGTFWDTQDTLLEDVDRIEVIRGPGATLWGSNAVNGVINVTTKSARDTQGVYATAGAGTHEQGFGSVRYGAGVNEDTFFRVWSKYLVRDATRTSGGQNIGDDWDMFRTGFRLDHYGADNIVATFTGDVFNSNRVGESVRTPLVTPLPTYTSVVTDGDATGYFLIARLQQEQPDGDGWSLQAYYDHGQRTFSNTLRYERDIIDLDWRHHLVVMEDHQIVWGVSGRYTWDSTKGNPVVSFSPADRGYGMANAFLQDTVTLVPDQWFVMFGSKVGYDDMSGVEVQPSARAWWTPDDRNTLWAAVSRPVRSPSRFSDDYSVVVGYIDSGLAAGGPPSGTIVPMTYTGNRDLKAETAIVGEAGYRHQFAEHVTFDLALFHASYDDLHAIPSGATQSVNSGEAATYGGELSILWQVAENWRLSGSYSYAEVQARGGSASYENAYPEHQFQIQSLLNVTDNIEFNALLYYTDAISDDGAPSYFRLDLGVTWRPTRNIEVSVWGQNLLDDSHLEKVDRFIQGTGAQVQRGVYGQVTLRF